MYAERSWAWGVLAIALIAGGAAPSDATSLARAGLDNLVAGNGTIVVGEVRDAHSYWNADRTFILTDVRVAVGEILKGNPRQREITVTLLGGTVGDLTTLIVGGAELARGKSYLLFLNEEDLPGLKAAQTVRDHCQGVFEIVRARDGMRAVSQANGQPLHPDALGFVDVPGGLTGLPLGAMRQSIREIAGRQDIHGEVQR